MAAAQENGQVDKLPASGRDGMKRGKDEHDERKGDYYERPICKVFLLMLQKSNRSVGHSRLSLATD